MKSRWIYRVLGMAIGLGAVGAVAATPLDDLRRLVEAGQFEAAYQTSQTHPQQIGTPHFDFLLGVAAIGSGHSAEGVLALERHLSVVPANDRARLEMARGYFFLGEYGRARTEFEFVRKHNPPREVQENIARYLESMQTRDGTQLRATSRLYLDVSLGQDSNVNGGTYNNTIDLFSGSVPIDSPGAQAVADSYRQLAAGGQWIKRVSPQLAVFAGGDLDLRYHASEKTYNLNNYGLFTGFSYLQGAGLYRVSVADSVMQVNAAPYRDMFSITGEAQYSLAQGLSLGAFVQYGEAAHAGDNQVRDSKLVTLGGTVNQVWESVMFRPSLGLRLSNSRERSVRMRPDLGRGIQALRLSVGASPMERLGVSAGLTWQQQDFGQADLAFGTTRSDSLKGVDLGINYALDSYWSVRWEWQMADNRSNQNLYDFSRRTWAVKLRREF